VRALDPNLSLVGGLMADDGLLDRAPGLESGAGEARRSGSESGVTVELISKVELDETARRGIARLIEPVSAVTARALLSYSRVPDLF